jgi:hypothetical protein
MDSLAHSRELALGSTSIPPKVLAFFFSLVMSFIALLAAVARDRAVGMHA